MRKFRWLILTALAAVLGPLALATEAAAQDPVIITGRVLSASGAPLPGATVFIKALNVGTSAGNDGSYTLTVPAARITRGPAAVTAQALGYRAQTGTVNLTPGARLTQNFQLGQDVLELEGIVATGQGTQTTRERLTTAVATVQAEEIVRSKEQNIVAALAGKAPGVQVTSSAGDPGAGAYIQIRGAASVVGGTQPLFVVDGTPIDNSTNRLESSTAGTVVSNRAMDLNPNDIENVEILKGAAATAIYGSRGANGVVVITTKGGRAGQTRATLSLSAGRDQVTSTVPLQMRFGQGYAGKASNASPFSWGPLLDASTPVYDHANELYRDGERVETNLTLSGGDDRTTYYLSAGRLDQQGVIVGPQSYDRTTVRLKGSHFFRDDFKVGGNFAYSTSSGDFIQQGSNISGIQLGALRTPPNFNNLPYLTETGLHRSYRLQNPTSVTQRRGYDNPFWIANELRNTADVGRAFGNVSLDYTPLSWLRVSYVLGTDYSSDDRLSLFPKSSSDFPTGRLIRGAFINNIVDSRLAATITGTMGPDFSGNLTLGQNLTQETFRQNLVYGSTLIAGTEETDFAVTNVGDEFKSTVRTDGYFANAEVTYADQLTLNGTARFDGSSTFGGDGKRFFYPAIGASWAFTNVPAIADGLSFLNFGKLRASYGISGRRPPVFSNVSSFQTAYFGDGWLSTGLYSIYAGNEGVVSQPRLANTSIRPEKAAEFEAGVDLAFMDNRVNFGVTYYDRKTTDAILELPLAPSTGFSSQYDNVAAFENSGWETTLELTPVRNDRLTWRVAGQWSRNRSCVTDLAGTESVYLNGFTGSTVSLVSPEVLGSCQPFGVFYGDDFVRFGRGSRDQNTGALIDTNAAGAAPGTIYVGADGFPQLDPEERVLGDPNPDWLASVRSSLNIGNNLTVSGLVDIKHGGDIWNGTKGALFFFGTHAETEPYHGQGVVQTYGQYSGQQVAGPGAGKAVPFNLNWFTSNIGSGFTGPASQFIEDAGFVKLRDISLTYTFVQPFVERLGMTAVDVTLSARNLRTWTNYTGIDPESNLTGQSTGRGLDYFNNPQTRSFLITVNLTR